MAIALRQEKLATTNTCTLDAPLDAGNLAVAVVVWGNVTDTITSVTDDAIGGSGTWVSAGVQTYGGSIMSVQIWYSYNCKAATNITITWATGTTPQWSVTEWIGADATASVFGAAAGAYASTASFNFGSVTPSVDGCLLIGGIRTSTTFSVTSRDTDWTALTGSTRYDAQYLVQATAAATSAPTGFAATEVLAGLLVWFKPAGGGGGGTSPLLTILLQHGQ